ncbi:Cof-type HAD-IIB family hydrolase [Companilactobacillus sp. HBUAS59544]|uniref:Cof-type HAD-IIB family hydrolase n=1 Tax=Companilactobacillus sp. HBUAS59544 TaxID=3109363 RepID=UPI002FF3EA4A
MIKHIFSDMDGTLLNNACQISDGNVKAIEDSQIPFTLVSARSPKEMVEVIDKLHLTEPQIGFNGGLIFQKVNGEIRSLKSETIDFSEVERIIQVVKDKFKKTSYSFYDLNNWYVEKIDKGIEYETEVGGQTPTISEFASLFKQKLSVFKIMLITFDETEMENLVNELNQFNPGNLSIYQSTPTYLEITSTNAQKHLGIEYIKDLENLQTDELAAFGDGLNDLSMLQNVGTPIVMENGFESLKKHAKYITKDNEHDGVAYGINQYLLNKKTGI